MCTRGEVGKEFIMEGPGRTGIYACPGGGSLVLVCARVRRCGGVMVRCCCEGL